MNRVIRYCSCIIFACFLMTCSACGNGIVQELFPTDEIYDEKVSAEYLIEETAETEEAYAEENTILEEPDVMPFTEAEELYIHVCGCVKQPGLYQLKPGDRIDAAIRAAGGFTKAADQKSVNLAEVLTDGEQIEVCSKEETAAKANPQGLELAGGGPARVNINTADKTQLTSLNGIGEGKAQAIITYREEHGRFTAASDICNVSGIGEGTYQKIKDAICIE